MARDPKYMLVRLDSYTDINSPDLCLFNTDETLILRDGEVFHNKVEGTIELLRHPEYFQMVSSEDTGDDS